YQR
ncbi:bacitracin resistance BacA family protein, partial [Vibrio parahaemolyticus EKP-021]